MFGVRNDSSQEHFMFTPMRLPHIQMLASMIMFIGGFLFLSMIVVAFQGSTLLTGIAFKMFVVGLSAGGLITILGAVLFLRPSLGQLGTSR